MFFCCGVCLRACVRRQFLWRRSQSPGRDSTVIPFKPNQLHASQILSPDSQSPEMCPQARSLDLGQPIPLGESAMDKQCPTRYYAGKKVKAWQRFNGQAHDDGADLRETNRGLDRLPAPLAFGVERAPHNAREGRRSRIYQWLGQAAPSCLHRVRIGKRTPYAYFLSFSPLLGCRRVFTCPFR